MALVLLSFNTPTCTPESEGITDRVLKRQIWKFFAMHLIVAAIYAVTGIVGKVIYNDEIANLLFAETTAREFV